MKKKHVLFIGIVALVAVLSFAVAVNANLIARPEGKVTVWPKNTHGVTYGSSADAVSYEDEPDLIRVLATNGKEGYAYRTDLEGPVPSSPAAAVAQQKARGDKPRVIPVYEVDGVTQIGVSVSDPGRSIHETDE
ncbi:MAG: hypothetical protein QME41_07165 [Actinomycetota bacterium]|nr:hypothetical protein [Actinomycetota bacterium]